MQLGFVKVDRTYVGAAAAAALKHGTKQFHLVSAANADADSWFLYPQTKGLVEGDLQSLGFPRLSIYRPAMLLVLEGRDEARAIEAAIAPLARAFSVLSDSVAISVEDVATAMVANTFLGPPGSQELLPAHGTVPNADPSVALVTVEDTEVSEHPGVPLSGCLSPEEALERRKRLKIDVSMRGSQDFGDAADGSGSGDSAVPKWPCTEVLSNAAIRKLAMQVRVHESSEPGCDKL